MTRIRNTVLSALLVLALPALVQAQAPAKPATTTATAKPKPRHETQAQLQKAATVTLAAATATAQAAVPGGKIASHELEREKGKLIYSFDIKTAGKSGIDEVNVDALTGTIVDKSHESPADEAKEAAAEKKAVASKSGPTVKKP
jgi:uncharacterized membrane protein YkoI